MCYRDKVNTPVSINDIVEYNNKEYRVQCIMPYLMATTVIVENLKTHKAETLLLRDVKKV